MLSADLLEDVGVHPTLSTRHRITAQKIDVVDLDQLVTEFFVLGALSQLTGLWDTERAAGVG